MPAIPILHIDDDDFAALVLRRGLAQCEPPVEVYHVSSGAEALNYLTGRPPYDDRALYPLPALILVDLNMPGLTGFDVVSFVRSTPPFQNLPVYILTSSENPRDKALAHELGATGYIQKDQGLERALRAVAHVLACRRQREEP